MKFLLWLSLASSLNCHATLEDLKLRSTSDNQVLSLQKLVGQNQYLLLIAHGTDCSVFKRYAHFIGDLVEELNGKPIKVILLNSFLGARTEAILQEAKDLHLKVPIYIDEDQLTAKHFGLSTLSEVAFVNVSTEKVVYKGAIDDRVTYYYSKPEARQNYLKDAIESTLNGSPVRVSRTKPFGCSIKFKN